MFKAGFIKRAASLLLAAITALSFPVAAAASTSSTSPYTGKTYTHATAFDGYNRYDGVDVSSHNGTVSWSKVKADGIDFAVIRAGFTGYTKSDTPSTRTRLQPPISAARAARGCS